MSEWSGSAPSRRVSTRFRQHPILSLRDEMDELFSRFFGEEGWLSGRMAPSLDLSETDTSIEVRLDLPGVDPKDIDVQLSGRTLTVRGERKEEQEEEGRTWHRVERRAGSFSRSVTLPCAVDEENVSAEYKDGVLTITLPKAEGARTRRIQVKG